MTDLYVSLTYDQYKEFERALQEYPRRETTHVTAPRGYYHKSIRLPLGDVTLEVHGPVVKEAERG